MAEKLPSTQHEEYELIEQAEGLMADPKFKAAMLEQMAKVRDQIPDDLDALLAVEGGAENMTSVDSSFEEEDES